MRAGCSSTSATTRSVELPSAEMMIPEAFSSLDMSLSCSVSVGCGAGRSLDPADIWATDFFSTRFHKPLTRHAARSRKRHNP